MRVELTTENVAATEQVRGWLEMWRDDAGASPHGATALLHLFDRDGFEIGNVPMDDSPSRLVARFALMTGRDVVQVTPPVVVMGATGTNHYGVRVAEEA